MKNHASLADNEISLWDLPTTPELVTVDVPDQADDAAQRAERLRLYRQVLALRSDTGAGPPTLPTLKWLTLPLWLWKTTDSATRGLVMAQLLFYLAPDAGRAHQPSPSRGLHGAWAAMTDTGLAAQTGLTAEQVRKARGWLLEHQFIIYKVGRFAGKCSCLIWLGPRTNTLLAKLRNKTNNGFKPSTHRFPLWVMQAAGGKVHGAILLGRLWWLLSAREQKQMPGLAPLAPLTPAAWWLPVTVRGLADPGSDSSLPPLRLTRDELQVAASHLATRSLLQSGMYLQRQFKQHGLWLNYDECCGWLLASLDWQPPAGLGVLTSAAQAAATGENQ